jgi:hypothetical protein
METERHIHYNDQLEGILQSEGEKAKCWKWLHDKARDKYNFANDWIAIPVIVLSTIAGTGSIGSSSLFNDTRAAGIAIGGISLFVGVLNTVANYYGFAKRAEAHKIAGLMYDKLGREITIELSLPRSERCPAEQLLKQVRTQSERLSETSPPIPADIIAKFKKAFDNPEHVEISKPDICNGIDPINTYRGVALSTPTQTAGDVETGRPRVEVRLMQNI